MARFPSKEADVIQLCDEILAGLTSHAADFPNNDQPGLLSLRTSYQTRKDTQLDLQAQAQLATEAKDDGLSDLTDKMKKELGQAEVSTSNDPVKLGYIGWGPKADPTSQSPGQPRNLEAVIQGAGTVFLDWKGPARGTGGSTRVYDVERRDKRDDGSFSGWRLISSAMQSEINLMSQTRSRELEYRVIAKNNTGSSTPSNTVMVVL